MCTWHVSVSHWVGSFPGRYLCKRMLWFCLLIISWNCRGYMPYTLKMIPPFLSTSDLSGTQLIWSTHTHAYTHTHTRTHTHTHTDTHTHTGTHTQTHLIMIMPTLCSTIITFTLQALQERWHVWPLTFDHLALPLSSSCQSVLSFDWEWTALWRHYGVWSFYIGSIRLRPPYLNLQCPLTQGKWVP